MSDLELFCVALRNLIHQYKLSQEATDLLDDTYGRLLEIAKAEVSNVTVCTKCGKKTDKCERVISIEDLNIKSHFLCPECFKAMDKGVGIYKLTKKD